MKWKYNMIFLFMLISVVSSEKLNAQYCLDFEYDKSGNRIELYVHSCGFEYKEHAREIVGDEEISEKTLNEVLLVYPNPTNGRIVVDINDNNDAESILYQIYNATGVLVQKGKCLVGQKIDITNNPTGVYLLRIIKGECVYSSVVLKL